MVVGYGHLLNHSMVKSASMTIEIYVSTILRFKKEGRGDEIKPGLSGKMRLQDLLTTLLHNCLDQPNVCFSDLTK